MTTHVTQRKHGLKRVRRVILRAALLYVVLGVMSCGSRPDPDHDVAGAREILSAAGAQWDKLFNARDAVGLAALYAADVASMPFNAPTIHGREALQVEFEKFFLQNTGRHETQVEEILVADDWAIERARYTLTYSPLSGGEEVKETGRHVVCRKLKDGTWQIAWELWNTDGPNTQ